VIYVTVGGVSSYGFLRLVAKVDGFAPNTGHEVIMQIGDTKYTPVHTRWFRYNTFAESMGLFREADLVISHCSTGTALTARMVRQDKPTIVMPRRKQYGEHFDDHQMELALLLEKEGAVAPIYVVYDAEVLESKIRELFSTERKAQGDGPSPVSPLIEYLRAYVNQTAKP
jgi:UDP-N-acetylglucosamine transferase subunit ALG13